MKQKQLTALVFIVIALVLLSKSDLLSTSAPNSNILGDIRYLAKGDSDGGGSNSGSGSSGSGSGSDSSGSSESDTATTSQGSSPAPTRPSVESDVDDDEETGIRTQSEINQDESRSEVRLSESERIRVRTKDGRTRIDITANGVKVRLEQRDDRIIIKAEQEDGTEEELEDNTILKIDDRLAKDGIKIATAGGERFLLARGNAGAVTSFPLSIDLATNTLIVITPAGEKTVAILPDQAIQNLLAANVVSQIGGQAVVDLAQTGELASLTDLITLGERNGIAIYEIAGISQQRLLGFIPVSIPKEVTVSAETGVVISQSTPFLNQVLDVISF